MPGSRRGQRLTDDGCAGVAHLAQRVLNLVEGAECECEEQGETPSGVHVCMNPRCVLALADAIAIEDYAEARPLV